MKLRNIPNVITSIRLILIVPLFIMLMIENYHWAFYVFLLAGLSDGVDGLLARRYGWTSHLGAFMDPLADKLLIFVTYVTLMWLGSIPVWLFSAVIGRDIIIMTGVIAYQYFIGEPEFNAAPISKLNTFFQILLVVVILFELSFMTIPSALITSLMYIVLITTVLSCVEYIWVWGRRAIHILKEQSR